MKTKKTIQVKNLTLGDGIPKIIIPIMAKTPQEAAARCAEAAKAGAELIELRADSFEEGNPAFLQACREAVPDLPILFTLRSASEGGLFKENADTWARILSCAIESGCVDLIDLELARPGTADLLEAAHARGIPVILSYHSFAGTPAREELRERLMRMEALGGDLAKIACMPRKETDVSSLLSLGAWAKQSLNIPALIIAMGELGAVSRVTGEIYGSAMSFACLPGEASAPGQLEANELKETLSRIHGQRQSGGLIFLIGFMGSGKSSVGRMLAGITGLPLIEMDERISEEAGQSIPEIFEERGEEGFRDLETNLLAGFWSLDCGIVSCGGGAVLREENRDLMRALGRTVLLDASPETILQHLTGESEGRPNIRGRMTLSGVTGLMEVRRPAYEAAADLRIPTDGLTVAEVCEMICRKLQLPLA